MQRHETALLISELGPIFSFFRFLPLSFFVFAVFFGHESFRQFHIAFSERPATSQ